MDHSSTLSLHQELQQQFQALERQVQGLGVSANNWMSNHWNKKSDFFNSSCFYTQSDELQDYLTEVANNLAKLSQVQDKTHLDYLTSRLIEQFSCFKNLLNSIEVNTKNASYGKAKTSYMTKVKKLATKVHQSSHELYRELSKLQEFERRLVDMVAAKQQQLDTYSGNKLKTDYQQQVLITQQRLGRCRQAISKVEEQIQQLDNRQI